MNGVKAGMSKKRYGRVLIAGRDLALLQSRSLLLGTYFEVYAAARVTEARSLIARHRFDLVILCSSLSEAECRVVSQYVQGPDCPAKILLIGRDIELGTAVDFICVQCQENIFHLLQASADALGYRVGIRGLAPGKQAFGDRFLSAARCS